MLNLSSHLKIWELLVSFVILVYQVVVTDISVNIIIFIWSDLKMLHFRLLVFFLYIQGFAFGSKKRICCTLLVLCTSKIFGVFEIVLVSSVSYFNWIMQLYLAIFCTNWWCSEIFKENVELVTDGLISKNNPYNCLKRIGISILLNVSWFFK